MVVPIVIKEDYEDTPFIAQLIFAVALIGGLGGIIVGSIMGMLGL